MTNLIKYIAYPKHITIYFNYEQQKYYIFEEDWWDAIEELSAHKIFDENGNFFDYEYNIACGELCREIYYNTHADELLMWLEKSDKVVEFIWAPEHRAYYNKKTHMLI